MLIKSNKNKENLYGNILFLSFDGKKIFRHNFKKAKWYLDRNLAEIVSKDPFVLKLKFKTAKDEKDANYFIENNYYISEKSNRCVVCGSFEDLTSHHVVPHEFRKYFPLNKKKSKSYDSVLLCCKCHDEYNKKSIEMYEKIKKEVEKYKKDVILELKNKREIRLKAIGAANSIIKFKGKIPYDKLELLLQAIKHFIKKDQINEKIIYRAAAIPRKRNIRTMKNQDHPNPFAFAAVNLYGCDDLSSMWEEHFVKSMEPKFLSKEWKDLKNIMVA